MPNQNTPTSPRFTGLYRDQANGKIELYYLGTLVTSWDATTITMPSSHTTTEGGAHNFDGAVDFDSTVDLSGGTITEATANAVKVAYLGSSGSLASDGADARMLDVFFVAPHDLVIKSAWAVNQSKSDVTVGTGVSSASYRRFTLHTNTAGTGSGTNIVASLNATASAASAVTRTFTTVASTVPAGAIVLGSQLTVGAATADGTDAAEHVYMMAYVSV